MADVKRRGRAVVTHIGREVARPGERVEAVRIGALVDEVALGQNAKEVGGRRAHEGLVSIGWPHRTDGLCRRVRRWTRRGARTGAAWAAEKRWNDRGLIASCLSEKHGGSAWP